QCLRQILCSAHSQRYCWSVYGPGSLTRKRRVLGSPASATMRTRAAGQHPARLLPARSQKTAPGGEIDALDPGGFGGLTITKAITIDGGGGQVASVLVAGTNGINVNAGASDVVILRNLRINGVSGSGVNGVQYNSGGALHIENCDIFGFGQNGILSSERDT